MNVVMRVAAPQMSAQLAIAVEAMRLRFKGRIVTPDLADYDHLRALAHINWDHRPLFVARVADAADVADVVDFARRHDLDLAVRSGGHSVCGHSGSNGVIVDLRDLKSIDLDLEAMTVWAGSGLTAGEVSGALDQHGVVVGFGDSSSVGIGGLTLGGGVGYMTRKHGLTIDSLLAAEIVTAAGDILTVDEHAYPDLFWALRGGGGNFGIVTRFKYRLNPLPEFTGGPLIMPATPEILAGFVAAAQAAPEELTTIVLAMPAPPLPFLPPELYGQKVIIGMMAYAGPADGAQAALAPFRALANPIADLVRPGPYSMMYLPEDPTMKPTVSVRSLFMNEVSVDQAADMLRRLDDCTAPMRMAQVRILGGAANRIPAEATAYGHRNAQILTGFLAMDGSAEAAMRNDQWAADCATALRGANAGTYVNFLAEEGTDALRASYPGTIWNRLREIKRRYDPKNLFRFNQNILPAE
jgi:FAD/FMN-containing dehydrogenase